MHNSSRMQTSQNKKANEVYIYMIADEVPIKEYVN